MSLLSKDVCQGPHLPRLQRIEERFACVDDEPVAFHKRVQ